MSPIAIALWVANVALETGGHVTFKAAAVGEDSTQGERWRRMTRSPLLWAGIVCFTGEFAGWLALLSLIPLPQAMLINSFNIVTVMLAGRILFRERLDPMRIAGSSFISIGVALAGVA